MARPTGYTSSTKKNLLLGAGAIYKNFVVGTDTPSTATAKIVGATQGGLEFKAVPTVRNIQIDGILGKVADLDVIDAWEASLTGTFIEVNSEVIRRALAAASVDTSDANYDIITANTEFASADYLTNITYVGTLSGSSTPVIIQIKNAVNMGGLTFKTEDGKEGTVDVAFEARYAISDNGVPPFSIYWPKIASSISNDLATLTIGSLVLTPTFDADTIAYTTSTTNASDAVSATTASAYASMTITANGVAISSGDSVTWESGSNTVEIAVTGDGGTKTYYVTVVAS